MLSTADLATAARQRRSPYSDKQRYQEYILQRIESYKNSIGRDELLRLGDEAARELQAAAEGQFLLTEVLMLESVDRLIMKRLALRPYRKWRQQFLKMREAQRTPTHWGLDPAGALVQLLPRLEPDDQVLIVGGGGEPAACLLAAHDAAVTFVATDLGSVDRIESRIAAEALAGLFAAYVILPGSVLPSFLDGLIDLDLVVLDPALLLDLEATERLTFLDDLQRRSRPGSMHILLPTCPTLAPEALCSLYEGWEMAHHSRPRRTTTNERRDVMLTKPCRPDTRSPAARGHSDTPADDHFS